MAPRCFSAKAPGCQAALVPRCMDIQLDKDTTMAGHYTSVGVRHWRRLQHCTRRSQKPLIAACLKLRNASTHRSCSRRFAEHLCRTPNGGRSPVAMPTGELRSQHSMGFFKDECKNLLWRRSAGWLDWMGRDKPERQRAESQWIVAGKANLSHDGLNPAHVPYWWVNNPTLGEFCFTMIGRAEIEGSKSNIAMNASLPQASYPCGNFCDTSSFKFRRFKGSLGHAFTMCRPSETPHLTMSSARIGPQREPWDQKEGQCPSSDSRNNRIPLVRTSSELVVRRVGKDHEGTVPSPCPGRHVATRSRRGSSSSSPPKADGFRTGTPVHSPQSQSFPKTYESILTTFLAYIVPSTRGCSPGRPDAVMSMTGCGRPSVLLIFKGRWERIGHHATCGALPAAGPYLRLSQFQGGQAVKQKR
ncbi:hypothetical protein CQW23_33144 [Capsicum baccatum]|uniref:Protein TAR1 n=1 Tax=Capsicum baccatum TaxID=33114 RepID=A0A2G2V2S9_CAPBA|nr:hypothetical protein CQW23_33144 [Capsicum baccatum]